MPEARRLTAEFASSLMSADQISRLELAITEVVANAVRHSGSAEAIRLMLTVKPEYLCVRVTDGGTGLVPRPGAMSTDPGAGYGLFLVEQLTRRWGVTREDKRTRVWFELDFVATAQPFGSDGSGTPPKSVV